MTDQGWMIDDGTCGTCGPCVHGDCWRCADPIPSDTGDAIELVCCCNEAYHIGYVDPPEALP